MRAVFQRVIEASVIVEQKVVSSIGRGALVLLGVGKGDTKKDVSYIADKLAGLRVFSDDEGKMNLSLTDISGEILVVPQFTLYGDVKKGKRPSFSAAASPSDGEELYLKLLDQLKGLGLSVKKGVFGADMQVRLINDGPVTILISSTKEF